MGRREGKFGMRNYVGSSQKVGGTNKGLGEAPKSCTRKEHESATNSIARRGQGAIAPCRVKGQRPLWGLGQRPNCFASDQSQRSRQQRRRQRSVPASNFARPQTRPKLLFPQDSVMNHYLCALGDEKCPAGGWRSRAKGWLYELAGCNRRFNGAFRRTLKPFGSAPLQSSPARALCHRQEGRF